MAESPFVERLRQLIAQAMDQATRGFHRAELAACMARHGRFQEAEEEIASLRSEFGDGRSGRVSIMIMCAEAQQIYYRDLGEQARDRMMRAQLLSVAGRDGPLSALTSAWLAHINFNMHRHDEMARAAKVSLDTVSAGEHEAASRLALTLGDAFYASEQTDIGDRWYTKAHERALKLGDHSTIAALTYNRAAMGTFMTRVASASSVPKEDIVSTLRGQVRTAINYQAITQFRSLQPLLNYALSSVHILEGKYADALALLLPLASEDQVTGAVERRVVLTSDLALCLAKTNQAREAAQLINDKIPLDEIIKCTPDDQVVSLSALVEARRACGLDYEEVVERLSIAKEEHGRNVAALKSAIAPFADGAAASRL